MREETNNPNSTYLQNLFPAFPCSADDPQVTAEHIKEVLEGDLQPTLHEVLRYSEPRTLPAIVANLLQAARILLDDFDGHGYEVLAHHVRDGGEWLKWMEEAGLHRFQPTFDHQPKNT